MSSEIKIFKYIVYEDKVRTVKFGTEKSKKEWEEEQKEWEEDGHCIANDTIECIGSVTPDAEGIEKLMDLIPAYDEEL